MIYTRVIYHTDAGVDTLEIKQDAKPPHTNMADHAVRQVYLNEAKRAAGDGEEWHPDNVHIDLVFHSKEPSKEGVWTYVPDVEAEAINAETVSKAAEKLSCPQGCQNGKGTTVVESHWDGDSSDGGNFTHFYCTYCGDTVPHRWNNL